MAQIKDTVKRFNNAKGNAKGYALIIDRRSLIETHEVERDDTFWIAATEVRRSLGFSLKQCNPLQPFLCTQG
jgi:hypothetical protein